MSASPINTHTHTHSSHARAVSFPSSRPGLMDTDVSVPLSEGFGAVILYLDRGFGFWWAHHPTPPSSYLLSESHCEEFTFIVLRISVMRLFQILRPLMFKPNLMLKSVSSQMKCSVDSLCLIQAWLTEADNSIDKNYKASELWQNCINVVLW